MFSTYSLLSVSSVPLKSFKCETGVFFGSKLPFLSFNTKKLPLNKAVELCNQLKQPVILIGGKDDGEIGDSIVAQSSNNIYNACGKYTLNQSASILQQAQQVIAHDTGMMHIAAALKKDIISIWGNTIPEFGMYPYFGNTNSLQTQRASHKILEVNGLS